MASRRPPTYRKHRGIDGKIRARCKIAGREYYLGEYGTSESLEAYERLLALWRTNQHNSPLAKDPTCSELVSAFMAHSEKEHRMYHQRRYKVALSFVRKLYGAQPISAFGPIALSLCRSSMVSENNWTRTYVNQLVGCIKSVWKWGASREMVPIERYQALLTMRGLGHGQAKREGKKVRKAPWEHVQTVLKDGGLQPQVEALLRLQMLTGCRPGEIVAMTGQSIDFDGLDASGSKHAGIWIYTTKNKTTGKTGRGIREIPLGPQAQELLKPWLRANPDEYLFQPSERPPSGFVPMGKPTKRYDNVNPGECYSIFGYRQAIARACERAGIPHFFPHQVRHLAGTRVREQLGRDAAQAHLGHDSQEATKRYAESIDSAAEIARKLG